MRSVIGQDHMAWETQGPIADRTIEHLSFSDRGVALLRKVMKENIEKVQRGEDPLGVFRDPNHEMINTNLDDGLFGADGNGRGVPAAVERKQAVDSYRQ
jgi:5,5'-dehydrodivanillate O-demethylase